MRLGRIFFIAVALGSSLALAQASDKDVHEACKPQIAPFEQSIPAALIQHLGDWETCEVKYYDEEEFGLDALIVAQWENVKLSLKYTPPEAASFTVEITGESPLTSKWYEENKTKLASEFFDMNWDHDGFPGPTSEYYLSPEVGTNAQFWAERDRNGHITWMRFSYAL